MNKIETVMKQGLEEFEVKLKDMDAYCASHSIMPFLEKNETWLKSHDKHLLDAVVAEVRGMKRRDDSNGRYNTYIDIETLINNSTGV